MTELRKEDFYEVLDEILDTYTLMGKNLIPTRRERQAVEETIFRARRLIEIEDFRGAERAFRKFLKIMKKILERRKVARGGK